ncbi:uncharacterized protein CLUP02_12197 [Colletotrichum lupini]|uniref:Uncharacterized protein n=1 Tax=Colletotrichum lupini TaxID=145971 RepID=A0A9Q8T0T5_9PEZI|nr:uncharacterized protein CLUP02_12197 [Colletotrichum lupini]UQC86695.1 hypothetical protein CLUP02_12197 [Colletotrichum lupini]
MVRRMGLAGLPFTRTDVRHRPYSRSGVTASALPGEPFFFGRISQPPCLRHQLLTTWVQARTRTAHSRCSRARLGWHWHPTPNAAFNSHQTL